jgi:hypothetical protein
MGKAVFCDRCGVYEEANKFGAGRERAWKVLSDGPSVADPVGMREGIMLCGDCSEQFDKFMRNSDDVRPCNPVKARR